MANEKKQEQILVAAAIGVVVWLFWRKFKASKASKAAIETPGGVATNSGRSSGQLYFDTQSAEVVQLNPLITADTTNNNC